MFAAVQRRVSRGLNVIRSFALLPSAEPHVRAVLKSIDAAGLDDLRVKYAGDPDFRNGRKYLRSAWYLRENVVRALTLGLKDSSPLRVLDIGSGAGYFLLACRHFGHEGIGVDLPGKPFYADMFRLLGLHRVEAAVMPKQPLREVAGTFDLITAFAVTFDRLRSGRASSPSPCCTSTPDTTSRKPSNSVTGWRQIWVASCWSASSRTRSTRDA